MPSRQADVPAHYHIDDLTDRIKAGLKAAGVDPARPRPEDLKPVDEFHLGGVDATDALLHEIEPGPQTRVLDLGCGIGGTARHIAWRFGARVTGIDLTPGFVSTARALSALVGLSGQTRFLEGSILDLPFERESFDMITMLHVGMNIEDKRALFREVNRVLASGGRFALYDLMIAGRGDIAFPVPWASGPDGSFLDEPEVYRAAARAERLALTRQTELFAEARAAIERARARTPRTAPLFGPELIMGADAPQKIRNMGDAVLAGVIAPWQMIFEKFG